jgi:hypothetical protein
MAAYHFRPGFWLKALRLAALASTVLLPAAPALAQGKIGVAAAVENDVNGSVGGRSRALRIGSEVFTGDRIQTGNSASAQLLFIDQTSFTIGPKADVTLDRFVFDPRKSSGNVVLETTKGAFRFISGSQNADNYRIKTPVATIGVRGSMISGITTKTGVIFYVSEGHGFVQLPNGQIIDNIPAGRAVIVLTDGRVIQTKFDVGDLDLNRLAELLPNFEDFQGNFSVDLLEQMPPPCVSESCYYDPYGQ